MESQYANVVINEMLDELEKNRYINPEKTIEVGRKVYSLCADAKHEIGMSFALWCVGEAYLNMSKYEKAMPYLFDSINLSQRQSICDLQLLAYLTIGDIYFDMGEYEKSFDYYSSAEKLAKTINHSKNYLKFSFEYYNAKIFNRIGEIYRILKCYEDAITYYELAVKLDKNLNYQATSGVILSNLGNIQYQLGNYDKALEYLSEAITHLKKYNYKIGIVEAYGLFALIHEKKENYEESEKYFYKALDISSEIDYIYIKIDLLLDYNNFLVNVGEEQVAIDMIAEIYKIAIDNKMYSKTMRICKRAIKLYEGVNDTYNVNKYYKLYFENEKKLEHIELYNRAKNFKIKVQIDSLEVENKIISEKSEALRVKAEDLIEIIKKISIISELGEKITTTLDLNQIYEMLHDTIHIFMKANVFGIALYNNEKRKIEYKYLVENNVRKEKHEVPYDNESSVAVRCLRENKIIVINDMHNEYLNYVDDVNYITNNKENSELNSAIYCPLIIDNNLIGVISVQAVEKDTFTILTIEMIKALSSYAAIAINNAIKSMNLLVEIQQRRKVQEQLQDSNNKLITLSENDGLTGIPNRRKFDSIITKEWNNAKKRKSLLSIIIFDVDCFKQYNDNYGHTDGDSCLIKISDELRKSLVKDYFAARYGGDEFIIVLPNTNLEDAMIFGEEFRRNVERLSMPHDFSKVGGVVTVTLGAASVLPSNSNTIIGIIRAADNALYDAKNKGRNQILGFSSNLFLKV